jgi:hypothetical protein
MRCCSSENGFALRRRNSLFADAEFSADALRRLIRPNHGAYTVGASGDRYVNEGEQNQQPDEAGDPLSRIGHLLDLPRQNSNKYLKSLALPRGLEPLFPP